MLSMTRTSVINELHRKARNAPKYNHEQIQRVLCLHQNKTLNHKKTLENAINALTNPGLFGKKNAEVAYQKATGEIMNTRP